MANKRCFQLKGSGFLFYCFAVAAVVAVAERKQWREIKYDEY
jgi:hypothetical protein